MKLALIPMFLRIWIALQLLAFVVGQLLRPDPTERLLSSVVWTMAMFLLAWGMSKHAKGAWVAAVMLGAVAVIGGIPALWTWSVGVGQNWLWFGWGLAFGVVDLVVLLSRQARDWVNEPTERRWTYSSSPER